MDDLNNNEKSLILKGIQILKSETCFEKSYLGLYLENRMPPESRLMVESHLEKCLYCLNQFSEIKELIYLEESSEPFSAVQVKKFSHNLIKGDSLEIRDPLKEHFALSFGRRVGSWLFPSFQWKYALSFMFLMIAISLASMLATISIRNPGILSRGENVILTQAAEKNIKQSGVRIDLLDRSGKNIQTISGVVINSNGLVLTNLKQLKKADSARVTFTDGSSFPVVGVQLDNANNLAVLKISQNNLVPVKYSTPRSLQVGDRFIHILDPTHPLSTASPVTITQVSAPKLNGGNTRQFFEITGKKPLGSNGILVNPEGETIGNIIEGEGRIGSAVTFNFNESFGPSEDFISISLIGK